MRAQPTHAQRRREALISTVAALLDQGEPTRFAYEGACRQGVRVAFVLQSWRWRDADTAAAIIVDEALRRLGIERPSWAQGQPEYVEPVAEGDRLGCANCGKTLPEDYHQTVPRKFCSDLCRRAANNRRTAVLGVQRTWAEEVARRAAEAEAAKAKRERKCVVCGTAFQPHKATQEVCSRSCSNKLRPRGGRQRKG